MVFMVIQPLSEKIIKYQHKEIELDLKCKNSLMETINNIEYIKLNSTEKREKKNIIKNNEDYRYNKIWDAKLSNISTLISEIFSDILMMMIYVIGIVYILDGKLKPMELMYLAINTGNFYLQLKNLQGIYNYYKRVSINIQFIFNILKYPNIEQINKCNNRSKKIDSKGIVFKNITFGYNNKHKVLKNLNIKFQNGQINLLLGPNGSGKSTIIKLLLRLYELKERKNGNKIYIDGKNIQDISLKKLRRKITYIPREPIMFNNTVWYNIKYGVKITSSEIMKYAKMLDLNSWLIKKKKNKVGIMGNKLSGGERKKVQLINALCKKTNIIIFDEPTNSLNKELIEWFKNLMKILRDKYKKTVIIITHDTRIIDIADNIEEL